MCMPIHLPYARKKIEVIQEVIFLETHLSKQEDK